MVAIFSHFPLLSPAFAVAHRLPPLRQTPTPPFPPLRHEVRVWQNTGFGSGTKKAKVCDEFEERVVQVRRVTKVVKGGKQLFFRAVVTVGDKKGQVGVGVSKAKEVVVVVQKSASNARRNIVKVPMTKYSTFPHRMGVQQKLISFFFHSSLVFIMFPLVGSSQEHQKITSSPSRTKDNNHIKMSPRLSNKEPVGFEWGS
ncbi:hypothetical protein LR48_Vigan03g115300 [Vigna angularis]|uniref:S5 DRBM domain-containing protein n=1 Tax=Phaseolus angularis TaxID=3914 RepID=A0A0L9U4R6_PHAAN|nr:hypothetical protein LR48_Vigan03g115300 [Vigna angularis]